MKTRSIGLTFSMTQDALRRLVQLSSKVLVCVLYFQGQMAVGVNAGGESAQTAAQARCDRSLTVVTIAIDYENAFSLVQNQLCYVCLQVCIAIIKTDARVQAALKDKHVTVATVRCVRTVWWVTHA